MRKLTHPWIIRIINVIIFIYLFTYILFIPIFPENPYQKFLFCIKIHNLVMTLKFNLPELILLIFKENMISNFLRVTFDVFAMSELKSSQLSFTANICLLYANILAARTISRFFPSNAICMYLVRHTNSLHKLLCVTYT